MKQKKNINIIVGTNNAGKLREIKDLLPKNLIIYSPKELKLKSPKENGKSFKENSLIKAKFFSKKTYFPRHKDILHLSFLYLCLLVPLFLDICIVPLTRKFL